jgi:IS5 family transposase
VDVRGAIRCRGQPGFFDVDERLERLSELGDQLEAFRGAVDFEIFRADLGAALGYGDGSQGGRPPFDAVMMFKILVIQAANNLSDERTEFLINDRLSFMRFLGLGLSDRVPDARTIWLFREKLTRSGIVTRLFDRFDAAVRAAGYIAMSGQIVDASLVAAPRQRNTQDGSLPSVDLAIPAFGYQNHVAIDRGFSLIRKWATTDAAAHAGRLLRQGLLDKTNTASGVWADTAYRSAANEAFLQRHGFVSHVHRKKPKGRPMPEMMQRANAAKSKVRSRIEHIFAEQKDRMGLFIRTIGLARATAKIGLANLVYNIKRLIFLRRIAVA